MLLKPSKTLSGLLISVYEKLYPRHILATEGMCAIFDLKDKKR